MTDKRQMGFGLPEAAGSDDGVATHEVIYADMRIGDSAGNRMPVVECEECGKPAITKHNPRNLVWIHSERISTSHSGRTRRSSASVCRRKRFE